MTVRSMHAANRRGAIVRPRSTLLFAATAWAKRVARQIWMALREWCGDCAYERYLQAQRTPPGAPAPLTPEEFYLEQLHRRYSRPNRCC